MEESKVPDWVSTEEANEPPETVILEGSPSVTSQAPQQIFVQGHGGPGMIMPTTNAVLALVLGILGIVACSVCTALPALILANGALATTSQYPGHPDQGLAKAAQIVAWIGIGLFILMMVVYGGLFTAMVLSGA
ncbi:MAG: DUF4190 domain-containing protein [Candidatus Thalassarchaeaceae archaeon]|jgi:hypothetical protein|nr:DUF4190 domain-containing protein [Candidatus Thalassarchaeaceae archaeon]|tara:strand:+ start:533 stop:934 length:402 start_codon:yes stop_codon:yes gene_type:complete